MKKVWTTKRNWEASKKEAEFETLMTEAGYEIAGYREYQSKTDYRLAKDGITIEWTVTSDLRDAKHSVQMAEQFYEMTKRLGDLG